MNPYLTSKHHPRITIAISFSSRKEIDCLIDTGFSGGIALPESFQQNIQQDPLGYQEYELADGSRVIFGLYEAKASYKNTSRLVNIMFTKSDDALVGIEFLEGFTLVLDLKNYKVSLS